MSESLSFERPETLSADGSSIVQPCSRRNMESKHPSPNCASATLDRLRHNFGRTRVELVDHIGGAGDLSA